MKVLLRELSAWTLAMLSLVPSAAYAGVRIVATASVPMGLYATRALGPAELPRVGAYVCLPPVSSKAPIALRSAFYSGLLPAEWKYRPLMKRVGGVGGDLVSYEDGSVRVNGRALPFSTALTSDKHGNPLPKPELPRTLSEREVWLTSEHPRGFDSRYFGAVGIDALTCVGEPLWTI